MNRNTVNLYLRKRICDNNEIRWLILQDCVAVIEDAPAQTAKEAGVIAGAPQGQFELDESYFGAKRIRGKRGRGAAGKTPVFGLLKRDGKVFVTIVENCSRNSLMPVIQGKILEGNTVHTDGWKAYDGLVLNGYDHYRVYHSKDEFARGKCHINGIESFWSFCKRRLAKFNGCTAKNFALFLKESQWRFNHRGENLYLKIQVLWNKNSVC